MIFKRAVALVFVNCMVQNAAFLLQGGGDPFQASTPGPVGRDTTLSLLLKEMLDLKSQVQNQEQDIRMLKGLKLENNVTTRTLNQLMSEFVDLKLSFGIIKHEFDQTNNLTGLQKITEKLDNMTQTIQDLTLTQQVHEIHFEETNRTVYQELDNLNTTLAVLLTDQDSTNRTLMKEVSDSVHFKDIHRLNVDIATLRTSIATLGSNTQSKFIGVRLVGGTSYSGRVELFYHGVWGTVCDDYTNNNFAKVVCRMLGRRTTHATVYTAGGGTLPVILDDVVCLGSENDLFACSHTPVYFSNCGHDEDIGVRCG